MSSSHPPAAAKSGEVGALLELGKLRLSSMAVFAVIAGLWLGTRQGRDPEWRLVLFTTLGTLCVAAGGSALNMLIERGPDGLMERTKGRPLPTGRLSPRTALAFGLGAVATGLVVLAWSTNALATTVCAAIAVTYVLVYTPLKRITTLNTLVGAIPGGLPPVVGYAAATGEIDMRAVVLFWILFFWQIPHFLAIAWRHRVDYAKGGMKMLPSIDPGGRLTSIQMVVYTIALILTTLFGWRVGLAGDLYLIAALFLGLALLAPVVLAASARSDAAMRRCFHATIVYLPLLLIAMMIDRT